MWHSFSRDRSFAGRSMHFEMNRDQSFAGRKTGRIFLQDIHPTISIIYYAIIITAAQNETAGDFGVQKLRQMRNKSARKLQCRMKNIFRKLIFRTFYLFYVFARRGKEFISPSLLDFAMSRFKIKRKNNKTIPHTRKYNS